MFLVKNIFLDEKLQKYGCKSYRQLLNLTDDELKKFSMEVEVYPVFDKIKAHKDTEYSDIFAKSIKKVVFNKLKTFNTILYDNTVRIYMSSDFWTSAHHEQAKQLEIYRLLQEAKTGNDTYQILRDLNVAVILAPGEETVVDWTREFVEDILLKRPEMRKLYVEDLETGKVYKWEIPEGFTGYLPPYPDAAAHEQDEPTETKQDTVKPVQAKEPTENVDIKKLSFSQLRELAKKAGINTFGMNKDGLLVALQHA